MLTDVALLVGVAPGDGVCSMPVAAGEGWTAAVGMANPVGIGEGVVVRVTLGEGVGVEGGVAVGEGVSVEVGEGVSVSVSSNAAWLFTV